MNKEIEDKNLSDHINKSANVNEISSNFTHQVMAKVENLEIQKSITDKPLIGFVGWAIFAIFIGLLSTTFIMAYQSDEIVFSFPKFDFSPIKEHATIVLATVSAICILVFFDILLRKSKQKTEH